MDTKKQEYMARLKMYHEGKRQALGQLTSRRGPEYEGFGESHHMREWSRRLGIPKTSLHKYLRNGLTIEEAAEVRGVIYEPENDK